MKYIKNNIVYDEYRGIPNEDGKLVLGMTRAEILSLGYAPFLGNDLTDDGRTSKYQLEPYYIDFYSLSGETEALTREVVLDTDLDDAIKAYEDGRELIIRYWGELPDGVTDLQEAQEGGEIRINAVYYFSNVESGNLIFRSSFPVNMIDPTRYTKSNYNCVTISTGTNPKVLSFYPASDTFVSVSQVAELVEEEYVDLTKNAQGNIIVNSGSSSVDVADYVRYVESSSPNVTRIFRKVSSKSESGGPMSISGNTASYVFSEINGTSNSTNILVCTLGQGSVAGGDWELKENISGGSGGNSNTTEFYDLPASDVAAIFYAASHYIPNQTTLNTACENVIAAVISGKTPRWKFSDGIADVWVCSHVHYPENQTPSQENPAQFTFIYNSSQIYNMLLYKVDDDWVVGGGPFELQGAIYPSVSGSGNAITGMSWVDDQLTFSKEKTFIETETDPTVPSWAKQSTKPSYTANEVGALPSNTHIPSDVKVGSIAGKLYRNNVGGSGNFSISGNSGCIPNLTAGTFLVSIYAKSETQNYTFTFNFGSGNTYSLSTTNGELNDLRTITISSAATFSGSVSSGSVATGTILYVVMYNYLTPVQTIGTAAVTNRYADLDGLPVIPNAPGTLNTNNTTAQTVSGSEALSGAIKLHKVAKTGTYSDLIGTPSIPSASDISTWNNKVSFIQTSDTLPDVSTAGTICELTTIIKEDASNGDSLNFPLWIENIDNADGYISSLLDDDPAQPRFIISNGELGLGEYNPYSDNAYTISSNHTFNAEEVVDNILLFDGSRLNDWTTLYGPPWNFNLTYDIQSTLTSAGVKIYKNFSVSKEYYISDGTQWNKLSDDVIAAITANDVNTWNDKQDALTAGDGIAIDNTDTIRTTGIPYGECDSTSTATAFTATVPGIYKLEDGVCVMLKNGVVTSAAGFTININGLGAKPAFNNLTAATRDTTIFNVNYTMLFVYDASRVVDNITGAWICYRGYDANTNTIGYQVRSNSHSLPASQKFYRYRLLFTSADGTHYVPANTSSSTNATASRAVNQTPIDPFGHIVYYGTTAAVEANARPSAAALWVIYTLALGYSFNRTGAALTLDDWAPVYIKCAPQTNGSAIMDADTPIVQALPTTNDGKIYIFLGVAYNATSIELLNNHPVYYHDGTGIRLWTGKDGYTKGEVDTALSGKQATLVSGTNLKTINNESLLGSGNISIQGGGGSANIEYNSSKTALVIGGGSTKYTISLDDPEALYPSVKINDFTYSASRFPLEVNSGDILNVIISSQGNTCTTTMGGTTISTSTSFSIQSVSGDIVITVAAPSSPSDPGGDGPIIVT